MGHFTSLRESTSADANEIHEIISSHPAFSYIRTSYLYDEMYVKFKECTDNLSEARLRTVLHVTHILDEIAFSLDLIDSGVRYSLPESIFHDAISNPRYKAYSDSVTKEARLKREQRARKLAGTTSTKPTKTISYTKPTISTEMNEFTSLIPRKLEAT